MSSPEKFLEPVSADKPAGIDPAANGSLFQLEQLIKVETGTDEETEPDWAKVIADSETILQGGKDLRVAVILSLALLRKQGLPGLHDGLKLLCGLVEKFWDSAFPLLDSEDSDPELSRANALNSLSAPLGKEGPYRFISYLRQLPLSHSSRLSNYGLRDILRAESKPGAGEKKPEPQVTFANIEASFRDSSATDLRNTHNQLKGLLALVDELEKVFTGKCVGEITLEFETLRTTLQSMLDRVAPYVQVPAEAPEPAPTDTKEAGPAAEPAIAQTVKSGPSASIQSPQDVEKALQLICAYYEQQDRSSPVPFFLKRALSLLNKDFMQSVGDLAPESVKDLNKLFGLNSTPLSQEKK
jgi:type VI secretion system protein ImpA